MTAPFRVQTIVTPDKLQLRVGVWEPPAGTAPRAICLLLNGLGEFLEKYGEVADELTQRGFIAVGLDWRSQGASERRRAGNRASHVASFDEYDRDLAALMLQLVEPMQREKSIPVFSLANSMGAHVVLRFLHEHPRRISCAVLIAPMIAIDTGPYSQRFTRTLTLLLNLRRPSERLLFGYEDADPLNRPFEGNTATSDRARFERTREQLRKQPYLRVFGATFAWLQAAFRSMAQIARRNFPESIATPLLVFGAGKDRVVKTEPIRDYVKRLPKAQYVEIEESEHEILMENDAIRARFWAAFDAFVDVQLETAVPFAPTPPKPLVVKPVRGFGAPKNTPG